MNEGGARGILAGKVKLGGEASVTAGPVGRDASAETDVTLKVRDFELFRFPRPLCGHLSRRLNHPTRQQSKEANLWKRARG